MQRSSPPPALRRTSASLPPALPGPLPGTAPTAYPLTLSAVPDLDYPERAVAGVGEPLQAATRPDGQVPESRGPVPIEYRSGTGVGPACGNGTDPAFPPAYDAGVTAVPVGNGETGTVVDAPSPAMTGGSTVLTGLSPQTRYGFTVRARDTAGDVSAAASAHTVATGVDPRHRGRDRPGHPVPRHPVQRQPAAEGLQGHRPGDRRRGQRVDAAHSPC